MMAPVSRGWGEACRDRVMLTAYMFAQSEAMVPTDDATYRVCSRWYIEAMAAENAFAEQRRQQRHRAAMIGWWRMWG
ncbi:hypothetical protein R3Q06_31990 [Rhodococcus erythropolis]|uniref:hypothetical protein n=1 Tax=Rhodococcus erythropolis TaxID=1833 RepID=UPI0029498A33|nr:hypothetical protein [Rhodococcus erythropolis]MDV6278100.1 hypothetical protein [Rhodococcus erythropolis]